VARAKKNPRLKRRLKPALEARAQVRRPASYGMTQADFDGEQLRIGTVREMEEHGLLADTAMRIAMDHLAEDPQYYAREENPRKTLYIYPNKSSIKAAERGLRAREKAPKSKRGGLDALQAAEEGVGSGVLRARDIIAGKRINAYQVKAFFDRHQGNYLDATAKGLKPEQSRAIQAWLIWGGDPLYRQVKRAVKAHREGKKVPYQIKPNPTKKKSSAKKKAKRAAKKVEKGVRKTAQTKGGRAALAAAGTMALGGGALLAGGAAYLGAKAKAPKKNPAKPFRSRDHDWSQVLISNAGKQMTRRQILNYYKRNKAKIWPFLEGQTVIVTLAPKRNDFVVRRKGPDGGYIKLTKLEGIDDPRSFEYWINRRVIEFRPVLMKTTTPIVWVDIDPHPGRGRGKDAKSLSRKARRAIPKVQAILDDEFGIDEAYIYHSGRRGYHVEGCPARSLKIDRVRTRLRAALDAEFEGDTTFTTSVAKPGQIRLNATEIKTMGALRAPYSLSTMGRPKKPS
jgi:hypothetical protein